MKIDCKLLLYHIVIGFLLTSIIGCSDIPYMDCEANPTSPLYGIWEVIDVSNGDMDIPDCENLKSGSRFIFACDSRVFIYKRDNDNPCTTWELGYAYKDSIIEMWEGDMLFGFSIDSFKDDTLRISGNRSNWLLKRDNNASR